MTATHSEDRLDRAAPFRLSGAAIYGASSNDRRSTEQQPRGYGEALWVIREPPISESGTPLDTNEQAEFNEDIPIGERIEFAHPCEEEFANTLDARNIPWRYKPRTFAVEWDEDGNFVDCFTPDFYLVADETYIALIAAERSESNAKMRNVRLLRRQHPEIRIEVVTSPYRRH